MKCNVYTIRITGKKIVYRKPLRLRLLKSSNRNTPRTRHGKFKLSEPRPVMETPVVPQKMPTPSLADSEWLLAELAKARETVLRIPFRLDNATDIQCAIDRLWNLERTLRDLLHCHRDGQCEDALVFTSTASYGGRSGRAGRIRGEQSRALSQEQTRSGSSLAMKVSAGPLSVRRPIPDQRH